MMKGAMVRKHKGKALKESLLIKRWKIVKGDKVEVTFGKDKGKQGEVEKVLRKKNKLTKRHIRRGASDRQEEKDMGRYWYAESPLHYSRLALVDPSTGKGCKVFWQEIEGVKQRVSKKTGTVIPKPAVKYTNPDKRTAPHTPADVAQKRTFDPATLNPLLLASLEHRERKYLDE